MLQVPAPVTCTQFCWMRKKRLPHWTFARPPGMVAGVNVEPNVQAHLS